MIAWFAVPLWITGTLTADKKANCSLCKFLPFSSCAIISLNCTANHAITYMYNIDHYWYCIFSPASKYIPSGHGNRWPDVFHQITVC